MQVNLSIKGVPAAWAERLRRRAEANHRSLQGELMAIIERAATEAEPNAALAADFGTANPSTRRGHKAIEQIAAEHRALYPRPFANVPRASDILREDRER